MDNEKENITRYLKKLMHYHLIEKVLLLVTCYNIPICRSTFLFPDTADRKTSNQTQVNIGDIEKKNRQFTYSEVLNITGNFQKVLGKGGFGTVYHGYVGDTEVAVKMLSPSSTQGYKEFQTEACYNHKLSFDFCKNMH